MQQQSPTSNWIPFKYHMPLWHLSIKSPYFVSNVFFMNSTTNLITIIMKHYKLNSPGSSVCELLFSKRFREALEYILGNQTFFNSILCFKFCFINIFYSQCMFTLSLFIFKHQILTHPYKHTVYVLWSTWMLFVAPQCDAFIQPGSHAVTPTLWFRVNYKSDPNQDFSLWISANTVR